MPLSDDVKKAIIAGGVSIVTALVTALVTASASISSREPELREAATNAARAVSGVPVGTIVASFLGPSVFAQRVGDQPELPNGSIWVPADGRSVAGTPFAGAYGQHVPDLRGVFLRGMNVTDPSIPAPVKQGQLDPEANRSAGSFQSNALAAHAHPLKNLHLVPTNPEGARVIAATDTTEPTTALTGQAGHGEDTRPNNVAVFYYVKVR